jgi:hypothetical protein
MTPRSNDQLRTSRGVRDEASGRFLPIRGGRAATLIGTGALGIRIVDGGVPGSLVLVGSFLGLLGATVLPFGLGLVKILIIGFVLVRVILPPTDFDLLLDLGLDLGLVLTIGADTIRLGVLDDQRGLLGVTDLFWPMIAEGRDRDRQKHRQQDA